MAFRHLKHTVQRITEKNKAEGKKIKFSVTTNGSLLNPQILSFFQRYRFRIVLGFDGLAQDLERKKGSMEQLVDIIKLIGTFPGMYFEINSVFSPRTAPLLSDALRFMIELGGPDITFNFSPLKPWKATHLKTLDKEFGLLVDFLVRYYKATGTVPIKNFLPVPWRHYVGHTMAISPEGGVWGCPNIYDFFKIQGDKKRALDYFYGPLREFKRNYPFVFPAILAKYTALQRDFSRQLKMKTFVDPVYAAYSSGRLGKTSTCLSRLIQVQTNAMTHFSLLKKGVDMTMEMSP